MWRLGNLPEAIAAAEFCALAAGSFLVLHFLPRAALTAVTLMTLASVLIGLVIGHCILSGDANSSDQ